MGWGDGFFFFLLSFFLGDFMLLRDEVRRLFQFVQLCRVMPLGKLVDGSQSLEKAAVLNIAGHHTGDANQSAMATLNLLDARVRCGWLVRHLATHTPARARALLALPPHPPRVNSFRV